MYNFVLVGTTMCTAGEFSLNDLAGGAGRLDIACRFVNSCFFLSHSLRRNVRCYLHLLGEPEPPKTVLFEGANLRYLNPDERSAGSLIKKALSVDVGEGWARSTPGVYVSGMTFAQLIEALGSDFMVLLSEDGADIRTSRLSASDELTFILGDHRGLPAPLEQHLLERGVDKLSVGPLSLHADHCVVLVLNELDRLEAGWR
ncbi:MAG TPA: tRNA (pseudouridine(54)-N(1))-methyltransferase TrmY [Methermicoccus shengliensis]|uniref:tRNA (pseudouridine(54)-N(1))-methyltransferase n=1 Tax=Methermicoccus shengliensis TaxID=660064 RepID=A0A832RYA9_9EURY|nr:tRNA (pseudouridine(54)-N(1))-methyltransferase TrmY [Methermicoccus shengliensis]